MEGPTEIDFKVHDFENLPENQAILEDNRPRLSRQCQKVYDLLRAGMALTTTKALEYGIGDLRARVRDLIKFNGIDVKKRLIEGRYKEYYL